MRSVARLRRYLVAGLLVWVPIGALILVFKLLFSLMGQLLFFLPQSYRPEALTNLPIPGVEPIIATVLVVLVILVTGVAVANLLGRRLVNLYESFLARIPLVSTVYGGVKHFVEVVFSDSNSSFKKTLLIEYPREGLYCLAFQTSEDPEEVRSRTGESIVTVFLPTTPNPTSGFMLFVPRTQVTELDMAVEDAVKMIISLGVVVPEWHPVHPSNDVAPPKGSS